MHSDIRFNILQLVYSKWAQTYDLLKKVKQEKDDNSVDWILFHKVRLEKAISDEKYWKNAFNELNIEWSDLPNSAGK